MLLLEVDGKTLFERAGIPVPASVLDDGSVQVSLPGTGKWIAKAQVPVGGRGKAGGIFPVASSDALPAVRRTLLGNKIKGHEVSEILIETTCVGEEHYLALFLDAAVGGVRVIYSPFGGVDIESRVAGSGGYNEVVPLNKADVMGALPALAETAPTESREAIFQVASSLAELFMEKQLLLAEINPLFALSDGRVIAGDAKVVIDMNTLGHQPELASLLQARHHRYPDGWRKYSEEFDFVEMDADGQIGLITTGAGLSMMLIDELVGHGLAPYNFCDVRTGQMRGSPERLLRIFEWLQSASGVRVLLVNVFAGITDLGEFANLLVLALRTCTDWEVPVVARLVGNGEDAARQIIHSNADLGIYFEPDLERAIQQVAALLEGKALAQEQSDVV